MASTKMMKTLLLVAALSVMLGGCYGSEADKEASRQIDDIVASTKTCGDYAALAAQSNCIRFVEEQQKNDPAFGKHADQLVKALEKRWNNSCAGQRQDIETLELKTTIALTQKGAIDGKVRSIAICKAQTEESLKAYPALAGDRSKSFQ